jgi:hypothetical protein
MDHPVMRSLVDVTLLAWAMSLWACESAGASSSSSASATGAQGSITSGASTSGTSGTGTGGAAEHSPFPQVPFRDAGARLTSPKLVSIMLPGYPFAAQEVAFQQWLVTSDWLRQVGAEYGIGPGTFVGNFVVDAGLPASDTDLPQFLASLMGDAGGLPPPDDETVYALFIPPGAPFAASDCANGASSYHQEAAVPRRFPYLVILDCDPNEPESVGAQYVGELESHEFIEAATDPFWFTDPAYEFPEGSPWRLVGGEVADLCAADWVLAADAGFYVQRVWSNLAAADGGVAPCVPGSDYDVATQPLDAGEFVSVAAGSTATVPLLGWAPYTVSDWSITAYPMPPPYSQFIVTASLSQTEIGNGQTVEMTVGVPRTAAKSEVAAVLLIFGDPLSSTQQFRWVVGVEAN